MSFREDKKGVVDCTGAVDTSSVKGKSVVITGGAGGMGEQLCVPLSKLGAFVTFGDLHDANGAKLEAELGKSAKFVHCDVTLWQSQVSMFKATKAESPSKTIDVVVANAGITSADQVVYEEDSEEPEEPNMKILDVIVTGAIYTLKLARYYSLKNPLALRGTGDVPGGPVYMASKWGARGLMRCMRRTTVVDGIRANALAPWFVATGLMSAAVQDYVSSKGVEFADAADAAGAMLKIASDPSINGKSARSMLHRCSSGQGDPNGYYDMNVDDCEDGSKADKQQLGLLATSYRVQASAKSQ